MLFFAIKHIQLRCQNQHVLVFMCVWNSKNVDPGYNAMNVTAYIVSL